LLDKHKARQIPDWILKKKGRGGSKKSERTKIKIKGGGRKGALGTEFPVSNGNIEKRGVQYCGA